MKHPYLAIFPTIPATLVASFASAQDPPAPASATEAPASPTAPIKAGSASPTPEAPTPEAQDDVSSPSASQTTPVWKTALTHYELGETQAGLDLLKAEVLRCFQTEGACTEGQLGTLYACVGILLSGGEKNHQGGVVAFRKALSLDPEIVLLPLYETVEVKAAFDEAKTGKRSVVENEQGAAEAKIDLPSSLASEEEERKRQLAIDRLKKRGFMILAGRAGVGGVEIEDRGVFNDYFTSSEGQGTVGGSLTVGGMPGRTSGFAMGGRVKGGMFLTDNGPYGHLGASGLLGSTIGKRQDDTFSYFLGGLGFDYIPAIDTFATVLSFQGGTSIGGLSLGGSIELEGGGGFVAGMIGLEVGFAKLL